MYKLLLKKLNAEWFTPTSSAILSYTDYGTSVSKRQIEALKVVIDDAIDKDEDLVKSLYVWKTSNPTLEEGAWYWKSFFGKVLEWTTKLAQARIGAKKITWLDDKIINVLTGRGVLDYTLDDVMTCLADFEDDPYILTFTAARQIRNKIISMKTSGITTVTTSSSVSENKITNSSKNGDTNKETAESNTNNPSVSKINQIKEVKMAAIVPSLTSTELTPEVKIALAKKRDLIHAQMSARISEKVDGKLMPVEERIKDLLVAGKSALTRYIEASAWNAYSLDQKVDWLAELEAGLLLAREGVALFKANRDNPTVKALSSMAYEVEGGLNGVQTTLSDVQRYANPWWKKVLAIAADPKLLMYVSQRDPVGFFTTLIPEIANAVMTDLYDDTSNKMTELRIASGLPIPSSSELRVVHAIMRVGKDPAGQPIGEIIALYDMLEDEVSHQYFLPFLTGSLGAVKSIAKIGKSFKKLFGSSKKKKKKQKQMRQLAEQQRQQELMAEQQRNLAQMAAGSQMQQQPQLPASTGGTDTVGGTLPSYDEELNQRYVDDSTQNYPEEVINDNDSSYLEPEKVLGNEDEEYDEYDEYL